jgi:hypothetical protein
LWIPGTGYGQKQAIYNLNHCRLARNLSEQDLNVRIAPTAQGNEHFFDREAASDGFAKEFGSLDANSTLSVGTELINMILTAEAGSRVWREDLRRTLSGRALTVSSQL